MVSICTSQMMLNMLVLICHLYILISERSLVSRPFSNFIFLLLTFETSLYILNIHVLLDVPYEIFFLPPCSLSFHPQNRIFHRAKVFIFLLWMVLLVSNLRPNRLALHPKSILLFFFPSILMFKSIIHLV